MKTLILLLTALASASLLPAQESREHPKQSLQHLTERLQDAKTAGRVDEAAELAAQIEKLKREHHEREAAQAGKKHPEHMPKHPGKEPPHGSSPEAARLHHVMQAVGHLKAAGLQEPANNIQKLAHDMQREMEERMRQQQQHKAAAHDGDVKRPGGGKAGPEIAELQQQVRQMAEQIERLQAELKKASDR